MHRRTLLQSALAGTALGALAPATRALAATDILWMTWENLAKDEYLAPFLSAHDVTLTKTFIGTDDEQFAKLRAGG